MINFLDVHKSMVFQRVSAPMKEGSVKKSLEMGIPNKCSWSLTFKHNSMITRLTFADNFWKVHLRFLARNNFKIFEFLYMWVRYKMVHIKTQELYFSLILYIYIYIYIYIYKVNRILYYVVSPKIYFTKIL